MGGLKGPWLGVIADSRPRPNSVGIGDLAAPIRDGAGRVIGVVAAHLSWRRAANHPERLTDESDPRGAEGYVLDRDGMVHGNELGAVGKRALYLDLREQRGHRRHHVDAPEHPAPEIHELGHGPPTVSNELEKLSGN